MVTDSRALRLTSDPMRLAEHHTGLLRDTSAIGACRFILRSRSLLSGATKEVVGDEMLEHISTF